MHAVQCRWLRLAATVPSTTYQALLLLPTTRPTPRRRHPSTLQARCQAAAAQVEGEKPSRQNNDRGRYGPLSSDSVQDFYDAPAFERDDDLRSPKRKPFQLSVPVRALINRNRHRLGLPMVVNWKKFTSEAVRVHDEWCGLDDPRALQQLERERKAKSGSTFSSRSKFKPDSYKPFQHLSQSSSMMRPQPGADPMAKVALNPEYKDAMAVARLVNESNRHSVVDGLRACGQKVDASRIKYLPRPPIVTIMGHVDHGKTTLLDCLRRTNVASGEAGGITQSIGAFQVSIPGTSTPVTFIDTPGHASFKSMRKAGLRGTDIVVLIISGVEGVQEQTIECINLILEEKIPVIVAISKMDRLDRKGVDESRAVLEIGNTLQAHGLQIEACHGDVMAVPISAKTGEGINNLLEAILLQSEMLELSTAVPCRAEALVLESKTTHDGVIPGATGFSPTDAVVNCIVKRGVFKKGMNIIGGQYFVKLQRILDEGGNEIQEAGPSRPVTLIGFGRHLPSPNSLVIEAGRRIKAGEWQKFWAHFTYAQTSRAEWYDIMRKEQRLLCWEPRSDIPDEALPSYQRRDDTPQLRIILKASTSGMLSAMEDIVGNLPKSDRVMARVIHSEVGDVNDNDGTLFMQRPQSTCIVGVGVKNVAMMDWKGKEPILVDVIYHMEDLIKERMLELLPSRQEERQLGTAEVKQTFTFSGEKVGNVAGLQVKSGVINRASPTKVLRGGIEVYRGGNGCIKSLRHVKDEVNEMQAGEECGLIIAGFKFEQGDVLEQYQTEDVRPTAEEVFGE
eukprot:Sspe_Gene.28418::Locus_12877_Transcript_1_2_Confidence_0.800_Length_2672::g.28418::m.28418/K02519/infB, MTIF2; translation initiation factor IF-2